MTERRKPTTAAQRAARARRKALFCELADRLFSREQTPAERAEAAQLAQEKRIDEATIELFHRELLDLCVKHGVRFEVTESSAVTICLGSSKPARDSDFGEMHYMGRK